MQLKLNAELNGEVYLPESYNYDTANNSIDVLLIRFSVNYHSVMKKLEKDQEKLPIFYDFLPEH